MKTLATTAFLTTVKAATLTSSFLLFQEGINKGDNLLVVLSWIMGAGFVIVIFNNPIFKALKA